MTDRTLLLVEDDAMVRSWVRMSLQDTEFRLIGEASSAREAEELVQRRRPEVLLVDYRLPDARGTELVRALRRTGFSGSVILMTANSERGFNEIASEAGAQGSVLKTGRSDELMLALRAAANGVRAFDTRHPKRNDGSAALSPREREVLRLAAAGATNPQIAEQLSVGVETVKTLMNRIFAKLGVRRRAEAVSVAHERGLL